ncbi:MAG: hypothetical protein ACTHJ9_14485 [Rhodanobacter sp.]
MNEVSELKTASERRYGYFYPKHTDGEVRVSTWSRMAKAYTPIGYFDGPEAEERALARADQLMKDRGLKPQKDYPGYDDVEVMCFDAYIGDYVTVASHEWNKEAA